MLRLKTQRLEKEKSLDIEFGNICTQMMNLAPVKKESAPLAPEI